MFVAFLGNYDDWYFLLSNLFVKSIRGSKVNSKEMGINSDPYFSAIFLQEASNKIKEKIRAL
jgi:hypothetical protein